MCCVLPLFQAHRPSVWVRPASKAESVAQWFSVDWPRGPLLVIAVSAAATSFFVTFLNERDRELREEALGLRRKKAD